jgi:hypothetical protein
VFKPGQGVGFLRATKTRCTRPLRGEEKTEAPCGKMSQLVKYNFGSMKKVLRKSNSSFLSPSSPAYY